ncbi:hypothetical protein N752_30090 [Desulforamulus aquiferis]|nr:nucleotide sugar dehydrogenase [Desulforamulus aquiferis]RYD01249.1 hypothetical protein N752_30090 [Desulforamulus aquiferis]
MYDNKKFIENVNYINLHNKIKRKEARILIFGLGYVGLPLAMGLSEEGYEVTGVDVNNEKVSKLLNGESYIIDISSSKIKKNIDNHNFIPTTDTTVIKNADVIIICVPTPLKKNQEPDMSYIESVVDLLKQYIKKGTLIILESTTYPGTTEELIQKEIDQLGYVVGEDYFLCFSPERVDPGNTNFRIENTPKVIGGTTPLCLDLACHIYNTFINKIVTVSTPKVAEMSKLLENTFRSINIAFINEMALMCDRMGVDIWEVIKAASSKPFGFMTFYPGPGIGGHCIPLDPMYLSWKAKGYNFYSKFIEIAQEINKNMPYYVVNKITEALNVAGKPLKSSKVLILGMAYKPDVDDVRESPSLEVFELLHRKGAIVDFNDPYVNYFEIFQNKKYSVKLLSENIKTYDCTVLLTAHKIYDYKLILENSSLIVDTRNVFEEFSKSNPKIFKIGNSNQEFNFNNLKNAINQ